MPTLGVAMISAYFLVERVKAKLNPELHATVALLPAGLAILAETPLVVLAATILGLVRTWLLGFGLVLIDYVVVGLYALSKATRALGGKDVA